MDGPRLLAAFQILATTQEVTFAVDSPLEKTGLEPSVPRKAPAVVAVSVLIRADFSVGRKEAEATWGLS